MVQRREGLGFTCEPCEPFSVAREELRQDLDRDVAIELRVARPIYLAHAARAEGGENLVKAEASAETEGQS